MHQYLGDCVFHIDAHYVKPATASIYCIIDQDEVAIIDTGTGHSLKHVKQFMAEQSVLPQQVKYVIPTHVHLDHAGGAGIMMRNFPNAQMVIHPKGVRHMIDPAKLVAGTIAVYGEQTYYERFGEIVAVNPSRMIVAKHESKLSLGKRELLFIDTPGHSFHHFCVIDHHSQGIFTGDTFGVSYPTMINKGCRFIIPSTTPIQFNPEALHTSVDLLMSYQPQKMYLAHSNVLPKPASVADQLRSWIDKYVALVELTKPKDEVSLLNLISEMTLLISQEFDLNKTQVNALMGMDIELNSKGLAYWYQNRD